MELDQTYVFSYGTLQREFLLHHKIAKRCQSPITTVKRNVLVGGYQLAINCNHAFPIAFPAENASIRGSILSVNTKTLREIIDVESDYYIKLLRVEHEGEWYTCVFFFSYRNNEKVLRHKSFLAYARQHKLNSLYKKK